MFSQNNWLSAVGGTSAALVLYVVMPQLPFIAFIQISLGMVIFLMLITMSVWALEEATIQQNPLNAFKRGSRASLVWGGIYAVGRLIESRSIDAMVHEVLQSPFTNSVIMVIGTMIFIFFSATTAAFVCKRFLPSPPKRQ